MRCRSDLECRRRVAAFVCSSSFIGDEDELRVLRREGLAATAIATHRAAVAEIGADADDPALVVIVDVAVVIVIVTDVYRI